MGFREGSPVISKKIGICKSFKGKIVEVRYGYKKRKYFHVVDPAGEVWIRHEADLLPQPPSKARAVTREGKSP